MPKDKNDKAAAHDAVAYVETVRENTRRYVEELRNENERLKLLTSSLETERHLLESRLVTIQSELELQVTERNKLLEKVCEAEGERESFAHDHSEIEEQNNNLANLYVATYGLHGTLDRAEVIGVMKEIITNLIGSEELAIFELNSSTNTLELLASQGIDSRAYHSIPADEGVIGHAVRTGATFIQGATPTDATPHAREEHLTACVPMRIDGEVSGVVAVFRLLGHKPSLEPLDYELFDLLARQAAIALHCTKLHVMFQTAEAREGAAT